MLQLELGLLFGLHVRLGFGLVLESNAMAGDSLRFQLIARLRSFSKVRVNLNYDRAKALFGPSVRV